LKSGGNRLKKGKGGTCTIQGKEGFEGGRRDVTGMRERKGEYNA